ncbi:GDP-D-mannose 4,6-dehydratase 1 [Striga asiatica]|uniref:GDP-D-mannose 4,6-dehydratase 1 n=1 Tax=Striga asiatica TaxID=4170 RepID=A0A5A7PK88_STRAF|nr:GDP-D-mannose 4,6-dehydratase 1 [Striga asiatica]
MNEDLFSGQDSGSAYRAMDSDAQQFSHRGSNSPPDPYTGGMPFSSFAANGVRVTPHGTLQASCSLRSRTLKRESSSKFGISFIIPQQVYSLVLTDSRARTTLLTLSMRLSGSDAVLLGFASKLVLFRFRMDGLSKIVSSTSSPIATEFVPIAVPHPTTILKSSYSGKASVL